MKTLLISLITILFLGGASNSNAQVFSGGIKAGANYSDFSHFEADRSVVLYHAGGYINFALTDKISIQAEGILSRQGYNNENDLEFRERTMYINTPLVLKYQIVPGVSILAGGRAGFLMSANKLFGEEEFEVEEVDIKGDYDSIDYGAVLGAELGITDRISIGATANLGFGSYRNQPEQSRQRVYQLSVAYRLFKI
jgi:hypothetical protein